MGNEKCKSKIVHGGQLFNVNDLGILNTFVISSTEISSNHHKINTVDVMRSNLTKSLRLLDHSNNTLSQKIAGKNTKICGINFWKRKNNYDINPNFRKAQVATFF